MEFVQRISIYPGLYPTYTVNKIFMKLRNYQQVTKIIEGGKRERNGGKNVIKKMLVSLLVIKFFGSHRIFHYVGDISE